MLYSDSLREMMQNGLNESFWDGLGVEIGPCADFDPKSRNPRKSSRPREKISGRENFLGFDALGRGGSGGGRAGGTGAPGTGVGFDFEGAGPLITPAFWRWGVRCKFTPGDPMMGVRIWDKHRLGGNILRGVPPL